MRIAADAWLLPGFALREAGELLGGIRSIEERSPFRHMQTRGGHRMSVAMTGAGPAAWVTDEHGYRYSALDPATQRPWPAVPPAFGRFGIAAAKRAGFSGFEPNVCVANRYEPKSKMSLHQDRNEGDSTAPIVSVSLGLPATFLFGGFERSDPVKRVALEHGDAVVWGGSARLAFHGVAPVCAGRHPQCGPYRYNLTIRCVRL